MERPIFWIGTSLDDLKAFPLEIRKEAGYQLHRVQQGLDPDDWKPFSNIGKGVREVRIRNENGIFRVIYLASFKKSVYVLHGFQKKTQKISRRDIEIAKARYKVVEAEQTKR